MKKKKIAIDADYLIFQVCEGAYTQDNLFANESLGAYKNRLKMLIKDIENEIAVEVLGRYKIKKRKTKVCFSDPKSNFRYDIYPEYKLNREDKDKSELFYRLRKWAHKTYGYGKHIEADDEVAHWVRQGYIGATFDKDLLRGVAGIWFDVYHTRRHIVDTSEFDARNFTLIQTLTGDPTDNIKALPKKNGDPMIDGIPTKGVRKPFKVTEKIAIELLEEFGWDFEGVIKAFESKGFGKKEAVLNRRLIGMDQVSKKSGKWKTKLFEEYIK